MPFSSFPDALQPVFQTMEPNEPITVFSGDLILHSRGNIPLSYSGDIQWHWLPSPTLVLKAKYKGEEGMAGLHAAHAAFLSHKMQIQLPGLALVDMLPTQFNFGGNITGHLHGMYLPLDLPEIQELVFHVPNFPDFHGQPIKDSTSARTGRLVLQADNWLVTIDNLSNTSELLKSLSEQGGFAITHTGSVKRVDSAAFTFQEVEPLMNCLSFFLSFVSGRWSPPLLWATRSGEGQKPALMMMANPQVAGWKPVDSWFNTSGQNAAKDISTLFPSFLKRIDEAQRLLQLSISWYLEVLSKSLVSDSRIVLTQVALELLAESLPPLLAHKPLPGKAENHLRGLLKLLVPTVPLEVPGDLSNLTAILNEPLAKSWNKSGSGLADGPSVVVSIRNKITHAPRTPAEKALLSDTMVMYEASLLSLWYLELVLLGWLGYVGRYRSRLLQTGWAGDGEHFPPSRTDESSDQQLN